MYGALAPRVGFPLLAGSTSSKVVEVAELFPAPSETPATSADCPSGRHSYRTSANPPSRHPGGVRSIFGGLAVTRSFRSEP
ncbi:MAG: hypothetical protein GY719_26230 [bacterium]|nr:hypothetical protein [bacterium]